jgi:large subunit ribosomal protein L29
MKFADMALKSKSELNEMLLNAKKEMMNLRFRKAAGEATVSSRIALLRKNVARIKTIMNAKKEI